MSALRTPRDSYKLTAPVCASCRHLIKVRDQEEKKIRHVCGYHNAMLVNREFGTCGWHTKLSPRSRRKVTYGREYDQADQSPPTLNVKGGIDIDGKPFIDFSDRETAQDFLDQAEKFENIKIEK